MTHRRHNDGGRIVSLTAAIEQILTYVTHDEGVSWQEAVDAGREAYRLAEAVETQIRTLKLALVAAQNPGIDMAEVERLIDGADTGA